MAVLTGVLKADFSEFKSEADQAIGKLRTMEGAAGTTTTAFKTAETATGQWGSALVSLAGAFGVALSVNSVKNFAIGVIEAGAAVGDMAQKLGISAEAVQRFGYAADQSGASIETVDRAIKAMNVNLAEGSKSTVAALEAAGLEFETIRRMAPEDAFVAIGDAVAGIEDPMTRAKVATELFGKAGQELVPVFLAGLRAMGDQANIWSDQEVARLKAAQDAWGRLSNAVTIYTGEIIADVIGMQNSTKDFLLGLSNFVVPSWLRGTVKDQLNAIHDASEHTGKSIQLTAEKTISAGPPMTAALAPVTQEARRTESAIKGVNEQATFTTQVIGFVEPKLGSLNSFLRDASKETEIWNSGLRFTSEVIGELPPKLDAAAAAIGRVASAQAAAPIPGMTQRSPGNAPVPIDTGNITYGTLGFARVFEEYQKKAASGGGMMGGFVGGCPTDFLTWALSMGLAQRGPTVTNTFNIVDTESGIARRVGDTITSQVQRGSLVN